MKIKNLNLIDEVFDTKNYLLDELNKINAMNIPDNEKLKLIQSVIEEAKIKFDRLDNKSNGTN